MLFARAFSIMVAFQIPAAAQPVRELTSQAILLGNQPLPGFYEVMSSSLSNGTETISGFAHQKANCSWRKIFRSKPDLPF